MAMSKQGESDHSIDENALRAYEGYVKEMSSLQLYTSKFTYSHHNAQGLTSDEFHQLLDEYHVPRSKRYGKKVQSIFVMFEERGKVNKNIIIFVRSEDNLYDVLVAEVTMESELNRERLACAAGASLFVSGALYLLSPPAGLVCAVTCAVMTSGKVVYDKKHHNFKDVTLGYMIKQLLDAKCLVLTTGGQLIYNHRGQVSLLDKPADQ